MSTTLRVIRYGVPVAVLQDVEPALLVAHHFGPGAEIRYGKGRGTQVWLEGRDRHNVASVEVAIGLVRSRMGVEASLFSLQISALAPKKNKMKGA